MNLLPDVLADAVLSTCGSYRYALFREKADRQEDLGTVTWVMLNPSTADAETDDPTLREVQKRTFGWGYGRAIVVNLYALRSSTPVALLTHPDPVGPEGDDAIWEWASKGDLIVAAWGAHPMAAAREWQVRTLMDANGRTLHHLGLTAGGFPKHPLARGRHRIPADQEAIPWA